MCGILAILVKRTLDDDRLKLILSSTDRRGSDFSSPLIDVRTENGHLFQFKASILHLCGDVLQEQPVIDGTNNVLLFNGQVYKYDNQIIPFNQSDTFHLSYQLGLCETQKQIADVFTKIDGPFAFVYWHHRTNTLFYGRDIFGRKSLCVLRDMDSGDNLVISSTATSMNQNNVKNLSWSEIDCKFLHCIDYSDSQNVTCKKFSWNLDEIYPVTKKCSSIESNDVMSVSSISARYLSPLNYDLRLPKEFSDSERKIAVANLSRKLIGAVSRRLNGNKNTCLLCRTKMRREPEAECCHSKVAVAFSGGLDSTLIALALDLVLDRTETIDLVTVAFRNGSPDRFSACEAFDELRYLRPSRNWRLVLCDISLAELRLMRKDHIRELILPCDTVIDDSLGCACWFIGRAKGRAIDSRSVIDSSQSDLRVFFEFNTDFEKAPETPQINPSYKSPASMIFVGSAIDEQLGGYSSHRSSWSKDGTRGVLDEISFQMRRLSTRNLGRDDRNYSDHGRDLKTPFLDSEFVSFLNSLPVGLKMDLDQSPEIGPKKILRELALDWGLVQTSRRVKRAMQFGSKIANLEDSKERGTDVCTRLLSTDPV